MEGGSEGGRRVCMFDLHYYSLQFLMSLAALTVLIVHLFVKPYNKTYTNIIETAILLNLLMVTAAFLDPSGQPVPEWLSTILVLLPYCYAVCYIGWRVTTRLW